MATIGRGDFPFRSGWFGVGRGRGRGRGRGLLRAETQSANKADLRATVLGDYFFDEAVTGITHEGTTTAVNTASNTSILVAYPSGILADDVLVLFTTVSVATPPNNPAGFTSQGTADAGGSSPSMRASTRVCDGSETGNLTITMSTSTSHAVLMLFRGVDTTTPLDVAPTTFGSASATSAYSLPTLTPTVDGAALAYAGFANAATGTYTQPNQPAPFTETYDNNTALPGTSAGYRILAGGGATGTVNLTRSTSIRGGGILLALRPQGVGGGGTPLDLVPAVETDTAVPLTRTRVRTLTPATETDAAVTLTRRRTRTLTVATETDTAQPLARARLRTLTPATETDTVVPLARVRTRTLTPATETDVAVALVPATTGATLTPATETDTPVTLSRVRRRTLTPAVESDTVVALARFRRRTLTPATETDTAVSLVRVRRRTLSTTTETNTAVPLSRYRKRTLTVTTETDTAIGLGRKRTRTFTPAPETDLGVALSRLRRRGLVPADELDTAVALVRIAGPSGEPIEAHAGQPTARWIATQPTHRHTSGPPQPRHTSGPPPNRWTSGQPQPANTGG